MIYLDSCALIKLIIVEAESSALAGHLTRSGQRVLSSEIAVVETHRTMVRLGVGAEVHAQADELLGDTLLLPVQPVLGTAGRLPYPGLRSLDAVHLASAQSLGPTLTSFITYDRRLANIAREAGVQIAAPGRIID